MQFFIKKYLVSICLIFFLFVNLTAQENKIPFTWLDSSEREMTGSISVSLIPSAGEGSYQLAFSVTWYDGNSNPITDVNKMPFLWLSKYDLDLLPVDKLSCSSFDQGNVRNLVFQSADRLNLQVMNGYEGQVKIQARFQYALTRALYDIGRSELIHLPGSKILEVEFSVRSKKPVTESEIVADNSTREISDAKKVTALKAVAGNFRKIQLKAKDLVDRKSGDEFSRPNYLQDLDALNASIELEMSLLDPDSLPRDSIRLYQQRYGDLSNSVLNLRTEYLRYWISQSVADSGGDPSIRIRSSDSLLNLIRFRFEPLMISQLDSLNQLIKIQGSIAAEVSAMAMLSKSLKRNQPRVDSLVIQHNLIKKDFFNLTRVHENSWSNYEVNRGGLSTIQEISTVHREFVAKQNELEASINLVDSNLVLLAADPEGEPWYMSNRLIWFGILSVVILVFATAIWNSSRNRRILQERFTTLETATAANFPGKIKDSGLFASIPADEYFTITYETTIPESVVGKIHYHISSIKSVYHLLNGAQIERNGNDFGGYLFGNQYKLPGKGPVRNEIFIERACTSKYLRSGISNDMTARADLIDELDSLVKQNKKYRLIGWFTSSPDNNMEIPEGLMKIHRSFFKEKWQIGILLNPASDLLQGASFLRRKSGYLDPMPDPAAFIKWDELYKFALNPGTLSKTEPVAPEKTNRNYSRITLNNTWGDSVVTAINVDSAVAAEISTVASGQAIPKDTFQVVGYLYGTVAITPGTDGKAQDYEIFADRFIELRNELTPRDLPGLTLLGWWGQSNVDVMNYLQNAIDYHEQSFIEAFQVACLSNPATGELRVFTRKHSMEMNNSTIETEEYAISSLLSR